MSTSVGKSGLDGAGRAGSCGGEGEGEWDGAFCRRRLTKPESTLIGVFLLTAPTPPVNGLARGELSISKIRIRQCDYARKIDALLLMGEKLYRAFN